MLARKLDICSDHVKSILAYCTPLYTAAKFKKASMFRLQVACNDCMHIFLKKT